MSKANLTRVFGAELFNREKRDKADAALRAAIKAVDDKSAARAIRKEIAALKARGPFDPAAREGGIKRLGALLLAVEMTQPKIASDIATNFRLYTEALTERGADA